MKSKTASVISLATAGLAPRGLSREQAASYVGVSTGLFDAMVADGRMPRPKQISSRPDHSTGRKIWDRVQLDLAFEALPDDSGAANDVWGAVAV